MKGTLEAPIIDIVDPYPSQIEIAMMSILNIVQVASLIIFIISLFVIILNKIKKKNNNKILKVCLVISIILFVAIRMWMWIYCRYMIY